MGGKAGKEEAAGGPCYDVAALDQESSAAWNCEARRQEGSSIFEARRQEGSSIFEDARLTTTRPLLQGTSHAELEDEATETNTSTERYRGKRSGDSAYEEAAYSDAAYSDAEAVSDDETKASSKSPRRAPSALEQEHRGAPSRILALDTGEQLPKQAMRSPGEEDEPPCSPGGGDSSPDAASRRQAMKDLNRETPNVDVEAMRRDTEAVEEDEEEQRQAQREAEQRRWAAALRRQGRPGGYGKAQRPAAVGVPPSEASSILGANSYGLPGCEGMFPGRRPPAAPILAHLAQRRPEPIGGPRDT
eukprot:TRINITY_DN4072_c0_g2_i2.p1 TRINITY_DN4072_c0_g2~~TRINITY_DN4072_c0_g2_i2.p1  ORF type:complete len:303 (-),score=80.40 TRINITY_DN4072_c0_g2_i2:151-1059(-)